ncbi:alpha/beta hydrolase [Halolactibacillus miurensis]|uniref:Acetyl esterase/lipase n=2 Tax=Halolactibacillus TaxID=306539 RepID=A0A1I6P381_9BACI|nr:alpha/beta hydrolase [Halolactibacillus miurensis]GEM03152.1 alpha/beta hydrolase [Halolactibacillus miurensis]SFS34540.1 Acetyl esterase/lipase [Halolactibacillus miurensis]
MHTPEIYHYTSTHNINMMMTLYRASENRQKATIVYFHGGGLLYGHRDDLPNIYVDQLVTAGYDVLTCDYPLAPEVSLDIILQSTYELCVHYATHRKDIFQLEHNRLILFGRSAGAYLALKLAETLLEKTDMTPAAIISLYGYPGFDVDEFKKPSKHYLQFPAVEDSVVNGIISDHYVTEGSLEKRFALYLKARQEGNWLRYLQPHSPLETYHVSDETFKQFPPTILAAATHDPDVPYRLSKQMSRKIPSAKCLTIYNDTHDFDRDTTDTTGIKIYAQIIAWLEETLTTTAVKEC